ncbi:MAG: dihydroorotase [FCB group bacterium]|nr:dihydroorotase [FCB group bacterium]
MKIRTQAKQIVLKGGTLFDPLRQTLETGDVFIQDGKIKAVGKIAGPEGAEIIDCTGLIVTHGFCDPHVHFREPGREDKETLKTGANAALAGGFTRVCVMPNTDPPLDSPESIRFVLEKSAELPVHIHPIGAITKGQLGREISEMGAMQFEGAVAFSDDGIPVANGQVMRLALEYSRMVGMPIINHAEDPMIRNEGVMNEGIVSTRLGLPGNPDVAESVMVHRDLELAQLTNAKIHVPHVSTAKAVHHIRQFKNDTSLALTAEVTPHHLYFIDEALSSFNTNLKVAPPIRSEKDRLALIEAVKDGTIDCIATDHAPHTIEEKEATFDLAPFGLIGLESCFGAVNKILGQQSGLSLKTILTLLTLRPRKIMGFETDLFAEGCEAELVVLAADEEWVFGENDIFSRSRNTPFLGETLVGKPRYTIAKGSVAEIG